MSDGSYILIESDELAEGDLIVITKITSTQTGSDSESQGGFGGMSGFPKRKESQCDAFDTGHSSTSISAGLGYVRARDLKHEDYTVISVIGDGSLTGGMAYEALNNASNLKTNFIVVLNDNHMCHFRKCRRNVQISGKSPDGRYLYRTEKRCDKCFAAVAGHGRPYD